MKIILFVVISLCFLYYSCSEDEHGVLVYDYHAHINKPTGTPLALNDSLNIEITFESHKGLTVHHINIRIFNKDTNAEVYNKPLDAHIHTPVEYKYKDVVLLTTTNGFSADSRWVLEAKVWGENEGEAEVTERVEFQIIP